MSELKPCPFCGADNGYVDVIPNPFSNDIYSRGHCIKCHAVGTFYAQSYLEGELRPSFEQMAQMATEKWNTRPIEDELRKRIAELEEENETLKTACDILRGDNNLLFKRLMSIETPDDLQTLKIVYVKEGSEVQE